MAFSCNWQRLRFASPNALYVGNCWATLLVKIIRDIVNNCDKINHRKNLTFHQIYNLLPLFQKIFLTQNCNNGFDTYKKSKIAYQILHLFKKIIKNY